jgi:hypothetical protein
MRLALLNEPFLKAKVPGDHGLASPPVWDNVSPFVTRVAMAEKEERSNFSSIILRAAL